MPELVEPIGRVIYDVHVAVGTGAVEGRLQGLPTEIHDDRSQRRKNVKSR